ncbi:MAG TPA: HAD family phosphatase [Lactovum miscens]|uniref:HAD family hydrolase n=1 Tax=Lactovum miscens TaxID=190387 RepID=UPI002ED8FD97
MKFKAVIFDMDGVIVDTERFFHQKRIDYLENMGIDTSSFHRSYFTGGRMRDMWPILLGEKYHEYDVETLQADYTAFKESTNYSYHDLLFSDVYDLLEFLKAENYKIGIASSSDHKQIQRCFDEGGIGKYFDVACSGEDFKETKPNPEIYLKTMEMLGVSQEETLIIEDSSMGIEAGKSAKATVWAIRDTFFGLDQSHADRLVESLTEVKKTLNRSSGKSAD